MKRALIVLAVVSIMVLGALYAFAYGPGDGPRAKGGPCWQSSETARVPNLTPEQKTKFQQLRQKFVAETAKLRGDLLTKRLELQSLWSNPKADAKAIVDKEKELRDLQNQMRDKGLQFRLEARQLLTPEQISEIRPGLGMRHGFGPDPMRGHKMGPGHGPCF